MKTKMSFREAVAGVTGMSDNILKCWIEDIIRVGFAKALVVLETKTGIDKHWIRTWMKLKGWKCQDRSNQELWVPPWDGIGFQPLGKSFEAAVRGQLKIDGYLETAWPRKKSRKPVKTTTII